MKLSDLEATVEFLLSPSRQDVVNEIHGEMRRIKRLHPILRRMHVASAFVKDWAALMQVQECLLCIIH